MGVLFFDSVRPNIIATIMIADTPIPIHTFLVLCDDLGGLRVSGEISRVLDDI